MRFSAISESVVKDQEWHHYLIASIMRREGLIICKTSPFDVAQSRLSRR